MEGKFEGVPCSKSSAWIECQSKNKPGKKYLFNIETGESQWQNTPKMAKTDKTGNTFSTPANDRLRKIRSELQKAKPITKKIEEVTNIQKQKAFTMKTIATAITSRKDCLKKMQNKVKDLRNVKSEVAIVQETSKKTLNPAKSKSATIVNAEPTITRVKASSQKLPSSQLLSTNEYMKECATRSRVSERLQGASPVRVRRSFSAQYPNSKTAVTTTQSEQLIQRKSQKREPAELTDIKKFKIPKKDESEKEKKFLERPVRVNNHIAYSTNVHTTKTDTPKSSKPLSQHQDALSLEEKDVKLPDLKFLTESPNNYSFFKRTKCLANQRLQRLRYSLQDENALKFPSVTSIGNNNIGCEAMDWEPIEEPTTTAPGIDESTDMDVDENLMLIAAEEQQETKILDQKWRKDSLYVVLDTNVLIEDLRFIEELRTNRIIDTPSIVIYIPYTVLQELDKLKLRESIKAPVVRAIRYLNKMFGENNGSIQAQTAFEECHHLIKVESSDDSILNCCLQVQSKIANTILLSEDVNMQNKAMCNNIRVSTISQFAEKKEPFPIGDALL